MRPTFAGLSIAISGTFAQQRALDVTGHNISNVNTPGYSRQAVFHASTQPTDLGISGNQNPMQIGTGVDIMEIKQYKDYFLDKKLRQENAKLGYWAAKQESVEELEAIFNDNSEEGLQSVMDGFWNSWSQLSKPGGGLTARSLVKDSAIAFVETVKNLDVMLENYRKNKNTEIVQTVEHINNIAQNIAKLNYDIKNIENAGAYANDFRDQRDSLINELSQLANIQLIEGQNTLNIALEGRLIVNDTTAVTVDAIPDASNKGYAKIVWDTDKQEIDLSSGSLKCMLENRDKLVYGYRSRLNELVKGFADQVNTLHHNGYGNLDDDQRYMFINVLDGSSTGIDLSNIGFNPELNDVNNIAAAKTKASDGNYEDGSNALEISELRYKDYFTDLSYDADPANGKYNFDEFYRNLISSLGIEGNEAATTLQSQQMLVDQIEYRRQALSGVSIDEEMSNLIRFEHSYNAAARVVNAMDEMLDIIINKTGISGR